MHWLFKKILICQKVFAVKPDLVWSLFQPEYPLYKRLQHLFSGWLMKFRIFAFVWNLVCKISISPVSSGDMLILEYFYCLILLRGDWFQILVKRIKKLYVTLMLHFSEMHICINWYWIIAIYASGSICLLLRSYYWWTRRPYLEFQRLQKMVSWFYIQFLHPPIVVYGNTNK